MTIYLVRHAKAGSRSAWDGDDDQRPLSRNGRSQAEALAKTLAEYDPARLVSSPSVRCVETLEPLAQRLGLVVEVDERLAEGAPFEAALDLIAGLPDDSVVCSHGDVIPDVVQALLRRGVELRSQPEWRKGSVWTLGRARGRFTSATASPPPAI